ncbi:YihY/virulence factor BrkB family protein [Bacillus sp. BRMEA1]|uniref:YihY/virulence factor BrkB family protein n=1 Tax=Neobacillus endophyticus TaxID=2738405 RepID=UPI0015661738|nr:YihY/virulence factor BrkB family protein [Neobacillus endophyticus]NRD79836.1 YihY/virulence factor BrkB family protein [Neobacillus endophyticus]
MQTVKKFFKILIQGSLHHNIMYLGSIIAYFGFASTIPLTLLLIFFASLFIDGTAVEQFLDSLFQSFIPSLPSGKSFVTTTIDHLTQFRTAVGVMGIGGLLLASVGGFLSLQTTLDTICELRKHRSFIKQYVMGFVMLGFLLVLILVSSLVSAVSPEIATSIANMDGFEWIRIVHTMSQMIFLFVMFLTCFLCYRILPSATLSTQALLTGATVVTIGVYIARQLFVVYTHHLGNYELIYGTLAFTTLVTFWIYIVSVLFLFGMELCVAVDGVRGIRPLYKD